MFVLVIISVVAVVVEVVILVVAIGFCCCCGCCCKLSIYELLGIVFLALIIALVVDSFSGLRSVH